MTLNVPTPPPTKPGYYWFRFRWKDAPWQPCEVYWPGTSFTILLIPETLEMRIIGSPTSFVLVALNIEWGEELRHEA